MSAPVNAPMTSLGIVITGKIGTTEIVIDPGTGTGIGIGKEIVVVIVIELVSEDVIVAVTMSVIEKLGIVIAIALEKEIGIMKLGTLSMIVAVPVTRNLIMTTVLNQNMRGTDMVKGNGIMTALPRKMARGGLNNLNMAIGTQTLTRMLSPMNIIVASMINWMSSMTMTVTNNILIAGMIAMIEWRRMITIMNKHQLSPAKGIGMEMWSEIIGGHLDHSLGIIVNIKTEIEYLSSFCALLVSYSL